MRTYRQMRMDYAGARRWRPRLGQMDPGQEAVFQETGIYPDQQMAVQTSQELAQYSASDIWTAYNWLSNWFNTEAGNLQDMISWFSTNATSLSVQDAQAYQANMMLEGQIVQELQGWVNQFQVVIAALGIQNPGLSGLGSLGALPALIIIAILVVVLAVSAAYITYRITQTDQIHEQTQQLQAKAMTQAQANVPALVAAGWTPDQISAYLKQQQDASKQSPFDLSKIPWKTLAVTGGVVLVARAIFG